MNHVKPRLRKPSPSPPSLSLSFRRSQPSDIDSTSSQQRTTLLSTYTSFLANQTTPPPSLFPQLLTSTSSSPSELGRILHAHTILLGYTQDPYISSSLLTMYSKSGNVDTARKVFDIIPLKTVVPWTAMIGAYSQINDTENAFSLFRKMRREGVEPNSVTALGLLSGVSELDQVKCSHSWVIHGGFDSDVVVVNKMLDVYLKCRGGIELARKLFESMDSGSRDVVSWNSIISGYSKDGDLRECVWLFHKMRAEDGINPDHQTFGSILPLATPTGDLQSRSVRVVREVHAQIITTGFYWHVHLCTTLMAMYMKCKDLDSGLILFRQTRHKDVVFWTSMISGLIQNERSDEALSIFRIMLHEGVTPSNTTLATLLAGCADFGSIRYGMSIHGYVFRQGVTLDRTVKNSLLTMYAKCGRLNPSRSVFDSIRDKDVVSWNAMVSAYGQNGYLQDASILFTEMRFFSNTQPDPITAVALLQACAALGILQFGRSIHCFIIQTTATTELPGIAVTTALIDMYSKSGDLPSAQRCFDQSNHHDIISWTAIISAYGSNGMGRTAIRLYSEFLQTNPKPNHTMLLTVLTACSHAGLVQAGLEIYQVMIRNFAIEPTVEHLACIIDLLCRAGMISEARTVLKSMPQPHTADVLGILLDACRHHQTNSITSKEIAGEIAAMNPTKAGSYVQLAQSHAAARRWNCVEDSWRKMRSLGLRKTPAWSFVDLNGAITSFFSGHDSHLRYDEILSVLLVLDGEMKARHTNDPFMMDGP